MKQRILLALVFVCAFMVNTQAQINKGAVWVGGSIGYNQSKNDFKDTSAKDTKTSTLGISPSIGIAVKENLVVGIKLNYTQDKSNNTVSDESKTNNYGVGIFVRQYIPVISRLYLFGEASANYTSTKGNSSNKDVDNNGNPITVKSTSKGWSTGLNVTPGLAFAVTKKFQVETSLNSLFNAGYSKLTYTTNKPNAYSYQNATTDSFTAGIFTDGKVQLNVGVRFLL